MNRRTFWSEETGQEMVEYTLLLAVVCLMSAALMVGSGGSVSTIWSRTSYDLSAARSVVSR